MRSNLNGRDIQPFFNHIDDCSCPYRPSVSPVMTIDSTNFQKPVMYWISLEGHLNIADIDGCACNLIASASFNKGLPPKSLTVDKMNIYWSNIAEDQIYFVNKKYPDDAEIRHFYLPSVRSIKALGKSLQTYPITNCLIPDHQVSYNVEEMKKSANSITVRLPEPVPQFGCERYSLPTTLYTIYVSQCLKNDPNMCENSDRIKLQTYNKEYEIKDLKPFTNYGLKLALSNYYANLESMSLEFGSGVVLQTEAGAPTAPENVTVEALTPTLAIVYWMPPKILNAPAVRYEVHWRLVRLINGARQKGEFIKGTERTTDGRYFTMLEPWLPDQEYLVFVRAYPTHVNDVYSESSSQIVKMYPEPNNLTLTGVSVNSLNVSWIPTINLMVRYTLEYKDVAMEDWQVANDFKIDKDKVTYFIKKLQPRTLYKFHLLLRYPNYKKDFVWPTDGRFTFQTLGNKLQF